MNESASDRTDAELNRLFRIYRHANLNIRYYGCRAETFEGRIRWINVGAGLLSALALCLLLAVNPKDPQADAIRFVSASLAGVVGIAMAVAPLLGWTEKARDCRSLHFAYMQLFAQAELVISEIRRNVEATEQHIGAAKMVHEAYMRIDALDEPNPDQKLIDREDELVRNAFPDDYVWTNF